MNNDQITRQASDDVSEFCFALSRLSTEDYYRAILQYKAAIEEELTARIECAEHDGVDLANL